MIKMALCELYDEWNNIMDTNELLIKAKRINKCIREATADIFVQIISKYPISVKEFTNYMDSTKPSQLMTYHSFENCHNFTRYRKCSHLYYIVRKENILIISHDLYSTIRIESWNYWAPDNICDNECMIGYDVLTTYNILKLRGGCENQAKKLILIDLESRIMVDIKDYYQIASLHIYLRNYVMCFVDWKTKVNLHIKINFLTGHYDYPIVEDGFIIDVETYEQYDDLCRLIIKENEELYELSKMYIADL